MTADADRDDLQDRDDWRADLTYLRDGDPIVLPPADEHCRHHGTWTPRYVGDGDCPACLDDDRARRRQHAEYLYPY